MAIKESSDELNPQVVTGDAIVPQPRAVRSATDYLALAISTCGVGYLPLAPGTWGSLVAVGLYLLLRLHYLNYPPYADSEDYLMAFVGAELFVIVIVTFLGIWAASRAERVLKIKDPGKVVVDEVAGQLIALLPSSLITAGRWPILVVIAFLLFRIFDIVKPYPARKLESLHGGVGIMADDLVAGAYAAVVVGVIVWFGWLV